MRIISLILLISAALLVIVVFYLIKPIPQSESYHQFADFRSWQKMPNALNVLSNIAIAIPGLWGLVLLSSSKKIQFNHATERWPWMGVSIGLILTAIGSSYYHLAPDNSRLVWDRLAMSIIFMSFVAALISERVNACLGLWLWPVLIAVGLYSVLLWYPGENGDLRFYMGIQAFTILVTLIMLLLPSPYDRNWYLAAAIVCYGAAVLFDFFDHQVYRFTREVLSGHTLKHLMMGVTGTWLIAMIWKRKKEKRT